jgi:hypothetical protein
MADSTTRASDLGKPSVTTPLNTDGRQLPPRRRDRLLAEATGNPLAGVELPSALGGAALGAAEIGE